MPLELLFDDQLNVPFLRHKDLAVHNNDPQQWASQLNTIVPVRICEPLQRAKRFRNRTAIVPLGHVTAVATHGSAIDVSTDALSAAQLLLPYRGNGFWTCDGKVYENPMGSSVLFMPPAPLRLTNTVTSGIALNIDPDQLLRTAITMAGPDGINRDLRSALGQPRRLFWRERGQQALIECVYRTLLSADRAMSIGHAALRMLRLDDLLIRLTVLLLVPELRDHEPEGDSQRNTRPGKHQVAQLTSWIDAHLDEPIGLSDLEAQSSYSRRALQYHFRQWTGYTPMQWLRRRRLDRAMALLLQPEPGETISRVATRCGYMNLSAFSRDFLAQHRRRPSDVLRNNRSGQTDNPNYVEG